MSMHLDSYTNWSSSKLIIVMVSPVVLMLVLLSVGSVSLACCHFDPSMVGYSSSL